MQILDLASDPALDLRPDLPVWPRARVRWLVASGSVSMATGRTTVARYRHDAGVHSGRDFTALFIFLRPFLWRSGDVYATLPLTTELARMPMSILLPNGVCWPLWAACLQLLVVIGLKELILGRWLTIVIALAGHFGSTLIAPPPTAVGPRPHLRISARDGAHPGYADRRRRIHRGWGVLCWSPPE